MRFPFVRCIFLVLLCLLAMYGACSSRLEGLRQQEVGMAKIGDQIPMFLPEKQAVRAVTFGYEHTASMILWFSTLNYVGAKLQAKESMPWFRHMCDLVTDLDPRAKHVYEFCGTLLSWVGKDPEGSNLILTKAIGSDPFYWRYWYLRGFNHWYFNEDFIGARNDLKRASQQKGAPAFLAPLASRIMVKSNNVGMAVRFLKASIAQTSDKKVRKALGEKLQEALVRQDREVLQRAIGKYKDRFPKVDFVNLAQLIDSGMMTELPRDPYGDLYIYDKSSGLVLSVKAGEGLKFSGKTARTGVARHEGWEDLSPNQNIETPKEGTDYGSEQDYMPEDKFQEVR